IHSTRRLNSFRRDGCCLLQIPRTAGILAAAERRGRRGTLLLHFSISCEHGWRAVEISSLVAETCINGLADSHHRSCLGRAYQPDGQRTAERPPRGETVLDGIRENDSRGATGVQPYATNSNLRTTVGELRLGAFRFCGSHFSPSSLFFLF